MDKKHLARSVTIDAFVFFRLIPFYFWLYWLRFCHSPILGLIKKRLFLCERGQMR